jgi:hypothetical protein
VLFGFLRFLLTIPLLGAVVASPPRSGPSAVFPCLTTAFLTHSLATQVSAPPAGVLRAHDECTSYRFGKSRIRALDDDDDDEIGRQDESSVLMPDLHLSPQAASRCPSVSPGLTGADTRLRC